MRLELSKQKNELHVFRSWGIDKKNGYMFQGRFNQNGQKEGRGIAVNDDSIIIGVWYKDELHGNIFSVYANGTKILQSYKDGMKHGHFEKKDKNGKVEIQIWNMSKYHQKVVNNYILDVQEIIENGKIMKRRAFETGDVLTYEYDPCVNCIEPFKLMLDYTETLYLMKKIEDSELRLQFVQNEGQEVFETKLPAIVLAADRYSQTEQSIRNMAFRMNLYDRKNSKRDWL